MSSSDGTFGVVGDSGFLRRLLQEAGLAIVPGFIAAREGRAWLADWQGTRGVLRGWHVPSGAVSRARRLDDVVWLHTFLAELAGLGFHSPRPLPDFGGQSWTIAGGRLWELVSYVPGHESAGRPSRQWSRSAPSSPAITAPSGGST